MIDDKEGLAETLLIIQLKHNLRIDKIQKALGEGNCELHEIFPIELHDIALDLLGVPEDETAENMEGFCRDWLNDVWWGYEADDDPEEFVKSYIEFVHSEMDKYRKKYYN